MNFVFGSFLAAIASLLMILKNSDKKPLIFANGR